VCEERHEIVPINDHGHYRDEAGLGGSSYKLNRRASTAFLVADEKRRMVAESLAAGVSVSKVAHRYGVNANLLQETRRAARWSR
jgi:Transposase